MTNPLVLEFNSETGQSVTREMNAAEFKIYQADQADNAERQAEAEEAATAKAAVLARLGITADEAKLLLG